MAGRSSSFYRGAPPSLSPASPSLPSGRAEAVRRRSSGTRPSLVGVFLYVPNLIGYLRILLLVSSVFFWLRGCPGIFLLCYVSSQGLDAVDGEAARRLNQVSIFGACLDQVVDRLSTCLLYVLNAAVYPPDYAWVFFLFLLLDVGGHWLHFFAAAVVGAQSHKEVDVDCAARQPAAQDNTQKATEALPEEKNKNENKKKDAGGGNRSEREREEEQRKDGQRTGDGRNVPEVEGRAIVARPHPVLRVYYRSRIVMCICILCYEGFFVSLLLLSQKLSFSSSSDVRVVKNDHGLLSHGLGVLLCVCTPFMLFKSLTNILQGVYGAQRLVCWDISTRSKRP